MVTDREFRRLIKLRHTHYLYQAADKTNMSEKTARKYLKANQLPSELKTPHTWKNRPDPFKDIWEHIRDLLNTNPGLEATTIMGYLICKDSEQYQESQLRTLQRRVRDWKATEGPEKEVMFEQVHYPGRLSQSDFTHMDDIGITINGELFHHMLYHFVLTYSNWEHVKICFSESFESLSEGLQCSLWTLGGVPKDHQTDQLSAAVQKIENREEFTKRYQGLLNHYGITGRKIQVGCPNENGDVEQRHFRFKRALKQRLMLRGSNDFKSRDDYQEFLLKLLNELNSGRTKKLAEELNVLRELPNKKIDATKKHTVTVNRHSTIAIDTNIYSVDSRLIGESVLAKVKAETIEIWYAQRKRDEFTRLIGRKRHKINYRHIIGSLIKKPGAFENYRYKDDLFPSTRFRMAFDWLRENTGSKCNKEYVKILYYAARYNENEVDNALLWLINQELDISSEFVLDIITDPRTLPLIHQINIPIPNIDLYDELLEAA